MSDLIKGFGYRLQVAGAPLKDHFRGQPVENAFIHGGKLFVISGEFLATFDIKDFPGLEASGNGDIGAKAPRMSDVDRKTLNAHEAIFRSSEFKQLMELVGDGAPSGK